jgi:hypothetical protein
MGHFYFDESIQEQGGFIVGAFVYSEEELGPCVNAAIAEVGLVPRLMSIKATPRCKATRRHRS